MSRFQKRNYIKFMAKKKLICARSPVIDNGTQQQFIFIQKFKLLSIKQKSKFVIFCVMTLGCYALWQKQRPEGVYKIRGSHFALFFEKNPKKYSKNFEIFFQNPKIPVLCPVLLCPVPILAILDTRELTF